jgi:hypothetical protein
MLASCKLGFPADIARKGPEYKPHAEKNAALPKDFKAIPGSAALKLGSVLSARMAMRLNSSRGDCAVSACSFGRKRILQSRLFQG